MQEKQGKGKKNVGQYTLWIKQLLKVKATKKQPFILCHLKHKKVVQAPKAKKLKNGIRIFMVIGHGLQMQLASRRLQS